MSTVMETNNYGKFVVSLFNRDVVKTRALEDSFLRHGWIDAYPLHVRRRPDGLLEIIAGHHRFFVARKLGIPVKYIECQDTAEIHELERGTVAWSLRDYLMSHIRKGGNAAYADVMAYHIKTSIPLSQCISMLGGHSASSANLGNEFKDGTYRLGDPTHANLVADLVAHCKKHEFRYSTDTPFVHALSKIAWAEVFDPQILMHKISLAPELLRKHGQREAYILMLEDIYNRYSRELVSLAIKAEVAARKRKLGRRKTQASRKGNFHPAPAGR